MSPMSDTVLSQIENSILSLTRDEQRHLLAKISEKLGSETAVGLTFEQELEQMAKDADIQREIRGIEADFRAAEFDGLAE